ncbi:MAG: hypothetical protein JSW41_02625, partial [Candidatus Aenigmatarchaeota archaeon]
MARRYPRYGLALEAERRRQTRQAEREVRLKRRMMEAQGIGVPQVEPDPSVLSRLGELLQTGTYGTAGFASALQEGKNPFAGLVRGLAHQEKKTWADVLRKSGVRDSHARWVGLGLDILMDPLTYVPMAGFAKATGLSKLGAKAGEVLGKTGPVRKLGTIFGFDPDLPAGMAKLKAVHGAGREYLETVWKRRAQELARKSPYSYREIEEATLAGEKLTQAPFFASEEMNRIREILETGPSYQQLRAAGYDREVIRGARRYRDALRQILGQEKELGIKIGKRERYWPLRFEEKSILEKGFPAKGPRGAKPSARPTRKRKFVTHKEAWKAGYKTLPAEQEFAARAVEHARLMSYGAFLKDTLETNAGILKIIPWNKKTKAEWLGVSGRQLKNIREGDVINALNEKGMALFSPGTPWGFGKKWYIMPKEISHSLTKIEKLYSDEAALNIFELGYDTMLNVWKGWATVVNPGFHFRNTFSNWFNMWLAGMNPLDLVQNNAKAIQVVNGAEGILASGMTYKAVRQLVEEHGIHGKGWAAMQYVKNPATVLSDLFKQENALAKARPSRLGRWLGRAIEDNARISLFIDGLERGIDPLDA